MVEGRRVMRNYRVLSLCEEEIRKNAQRFSEYLIRQVLAFGIAGQSAYGVCQ